jgi:beta-glucosidase
VTTTLPDRTTDTRPWLDASWEPRDRARALVAAMTLEQRIAQLHGAMETIDIHALTAQVAEEGGDLDQLAEQIQVERHVPPIEELGIPRFGSRTARSASVWATAPPALPPRRCR